MGKKTKEPVIHPIIVPTPSSLSSCDFYLIKNQDSLLLIDAGINTEECWDYFMEVLQENGFGIETIDKIILTHSHPDHTGLVNKIVSVKDIPVFAHDESIVRLKRDRKFLNERIAFFQSLYSEMGCKKSGEKQVEKLKRAAKENKSQMIMGEIMPLKDGDVIGGVKVIETPGHAPDHIALFHSASGSLIAGDHLIQHVSSNALIEPDKHGKRMYSLQQYEKSLERCQKLPLSVVYPGHGEIIMDPHTLIEKRLKGIERKAEEIKHIIHNSSYTAAEIAQLYYKEKYDSAFSLVMSKIIGHLDRLEALNEISREQRNGEWYYSNVTVTTERRSI